MCKKKKAPVPDADGHVLHIWSPLKFETPPDYSYLRKSFSSRAANWLLRFVGHFLLWIVNKIALGFEIHGSENLDALSEKGAVTICNHIHPMDCTMIDMAMVTRKMYYITLESNFKIPVVRHLIRGFGGVPISSSAHTTAKLFSAMREAIGQGNCVQVYPEGVLLPYCNKLRKFRDGAFRLAVDSGAPVLPMLITMHEPSGIFSLYKKKPCLHLNFLPAVYADFGIEKHKAIKKLREDCEREMDLFLKGECPITQPELEQTDENEKEAPIPDAT